MPSDDDYTPVGPQSSFMMRLLTHRSMELLGLVLLVLAVCICLSLFTFNPQDSSFNAATGNPPTNLLGRAGATIANILIEWLGLGCVLPVIILLAWTWRLMHHHHIGALVLRFVAALLLLPSGAFLIGILQLTLPGLNVAWPSASGLGGTCGTALARYTLTAMQAMTGAAGGLVAMLMALLLVSLLAPLTLGLNGHEWRLIGRTFWWLVRTPVKLVRRGTSAPETASSSPGTTGFYGNHAGMPARPPHMLATSRTANPTGFLHYYRNKKATRARKTAGADHSSVQSWISPPPPLPGLSADPSQAIMVKTAPLAHNTDSQYKADRHDTSQHDTVDAVIDEATSPNRYGMQLAQIQRDREISGKYAFSAILHDDYSDLYEEELPDVPSASGPDSEAEITARKPSLFERMTGRVPVTPAFGHIMAPQGSSTPERTHQAGSSALMALQAPDRTAGSEQTVQTWEPPSLALLNPPPASHMIGPSEESLNQHARLLENVLRDYGVQGEIHNYHTGPVVTLYELEPAPGVRTQRVIGLSDDIARSLSVLSVRIATVPGRNVIGIEVPNPTRETVYFPELLHTEEWCNTRSRLLLALGKDIAGVPVYADLAKMPHLLVAGTTGSGKSVGINAMILSLLYRLSPEDCRLIMIDPKILELSIYEGIPHLMTPVVTEPPKAVSALKWAVQEMDRRYRLMAGHQVRNIGSYNDRIRHLRDTGETPTRRVQTGFDPETGRPVFDEHRLPLEHLPYIVVVIDEMADLMMAAGKEIEAAVLRLAQKARAAGIHVIMATQRPSVDVITGTIKANFPTRISFQVTNKFDSRTILQEQGAEQLLGRGDMLFMQGGGRITRVHGPFISDEEVEAVVEDLRSKGQPVYNADVVADHEEEENTARTTSRTLDQDGSNDLYEQAVDLVMREKKASISFVQRHLSIGYNRAANIIDQMEREGIIGPPNHVGRREILKTVHPLRNQGEEMQGYDEG